MVCKNCGNQMSEGANFCRHCGAPAAVREKSVTVSQKSAAATQEPTAAAQTTAAVTQEPVTVKKRHIRQALVSLLLFLIFTGGLAVSGRFIFSTWQESRTPYQEAAFAALDEELAMREGCAAGISDLDALLRNNAQKITELEYKLARYRLRREREVLNSVTDSVEFDYDALFATEYFSSAYLQYIDDLLNAFRQDALTDSWLHSYYDYSSDSGANTHINQDLWIYDSDRADEKFSGLLDPRRFCVSVYTATLTDHFTQNGHLYVTGLDVLNTLFRIPGYVLDDSVFVKAYGGSPSPAEMEVPGWSMQDYDDFWESAGSRSDSPYAVWEAFGMSSVDFDIDWNNLVDEDAYYRAYEEFMDTIAPGLERYDMALYVPDDDYYGGVRYELSGNEATLKEIAAAYITGHPDCLEELGINKDALPSSYDDQIAEVKLQLEELEKTAEKLTLQRDEVKWLLDSKVFFRQQRETLLAMEQQHMELLTRTLLIFTLICLFLLIMAVSSLRRFIRALR